jgi:hypothetical protein
MAANPSTNTAADCLNGVSAFAAECAEIDARRVGEFLRRHKIAPPPGESRKLPTAHLLDLAAALRLAGWEWAGLDIHRRAGLPPARDAICNVLLAPTRPGSGLVERAVPTLYPAVLHLLIEHFAWSGLRDLGAEMILDTPDEDALVEAMARFLWAHRHLAKNSDRRPAS